MDIFTTFFSFMNPVSGDGLLHEEGASYLREIMKDTMYIKKLLLHNALFDTCITMKLCNRYHGTHFKSSMNAD